jgi:hypothetical protein
LFQLKNAGCIISASDCVPSAKSIEINLGRQQHHGIIDGNNTRVTIENTIAKNPELDLSDVWIPIRVYTGLTRKEVETVAEGHNIRKKVEKYSLLNYLGIFNDLKDNLSTAFGPDILKHVSWCEGDKLPDGKSKPIHVVEIIQAIETLNLERYGRRMSVDSIANPVLYGHKGKAFTNFATDSANGVGGRLVGFAPEILAVYHTICARLEKAWNKVGGRYANIGGKPEKRGSNKLIVPRQRYHFIGKDSGNNCQPLAFLILSAWRANVKWGDEKLSWHIRPNSFLNGTMERFLKRVYKNVGAAAGGTVTLRDALENQAKYNGDLYELLYNDSFQYVVAQGKQPTVLP